MLQSYEKGTPKQDKSKDKLWSVELINKHFRAFRIDRYTRKPLFKTLVASGCLYLLTQYTGNFYSFLSRLTSLDGVSTTKWIQTRRRDEKHCHGNLNEWIL